MSFACTAKWIGVYPLRLGSGYFSQMTTIKTALLKKIKLPSWIYPRRALEAALRTPVFPSTLPYAEGYIRHYRVRLFL